MFRAWRTLVGLWFVCGMVVGPGRAEWRISPTSTYTGMCDASGGVALGTNLFAVADDEENQLFIYSAEASGPPRRIEDVTGFLNLTGKFPETDLEGAAWLGDKIFWIGSHGRNRDGKDRPNRRCFFATTVQRTTNGVRLVPAGQCYKKLLRDLSKSKNLRAFNFAGAAMLPPKAKDALNIEGLCAGPDGSLLLGFRNPIPQGNALVVPLQNPNQVITGQPAKFGFATLLDLGGLGIRDLANWQGKYLILAGAYDTEKIFRLYVWNGGLDVPQAIPGLDFHGLTPEALVVFPGRKDIMVLSDDGTLKIKGIECKHLADPNQRHFQAVWITP